MREPDPELAKGEGYVAFNNGAKVRDNPFPVASDAWFEWLHGFAMGIALVAKRVKCGSADGGATKAG